MKKRIRQNVLESLLADKNSEAYKKYNAKIEKQREKEEREFRKQWLENLWRDRNQGALNCRLKAIAEGKISHPTYIIRGPKDPKIDEKPISKSDSTSS